VYISSRQIEEFFSSRSRLAQGLLPHLVRRLIVESVPAAELTSMRIPVEDDVGMRGFDGVIDVSSPVGPFVPDGKSVWEISTGDPGDKFADNYGKRKKEANRQTAFVFVSPRAWKGKALDELLARSRADGLWRSVKVIDSVQLEQWLEIRPTTSRWLLTQMGIPSCGYWDASAYVAEEVSGRYGIRVDLGLVLGGRDDEAAELTSWLASTSPRHRIIADTAEEAAAFIAATLLQSEEHCPSRKSRVLFIKDPEALSLATISQSAYVVIPLSEAVRKKAESLVSEGARLLHPCTRVEREQVARTGETVLPPSRRESLEASLQVMGYQRDQAHTIARESKGSLTAVLWQIQDAGDIAQEWTRPDAAEQLIPILLAAEWEDENEADWELIGALADQPEEECHSVAKRWEWPAGPLIRRGSRWDWVAWPYAFRRLAQYIDDQITARFVRFSVDVLSERDPSLDMPAEDRWLGNIHGKITRHSPAVRSGLAGSTVLMAIHGHRARGADAQGCANRIVRDILCVDPDKTAERWLSVASLLDDLAEAAPDVFLECGAGLITNEIALREMFRETGYFGGSPHTYVLWAAERLAWSADYLTLAVLYLGTLAEKDPGGHLANRPANSLAEILLGWHPNTTASLSQRLDAVDALREAHPDVAWSTCEELFSGRRTISSSTAKPRWRDWDQGWRAPTLEEVRRFAKGLLVRLVSWAGDSGSHWAQLVESFERLKGATHMQNQLIEGLRAFGKLGVPEIEKAQVADALRVLLSKHRRFEHSKWALAKSELAPLDDLLQYFEPADPVTRNRWLFEGLPEIPAPQEADIQERHKLARAARKLAITEILDTRGLDGVLQMSSCARNPEQVGSALADANLDQDIEDRFLTTALHWESATPEAPKELQAAWQYIAESYARGGEDWLNVVLRNPSIHLDRACLVNLALALPASAKTWDAIREWGEGVEEAYWKRSAISLVRDPSASANRAVRSLLDVGRPFRALEVVCLAEHRTNPKSKGPKHVSPDLIVEVLRLLTVHDIEEDWYPPDVGSISYYVERLFILLDEADVELVTVAQLEFVLLPYLEHTDRGPKSLVAAIETTPQLFVDLLGSVYRGEGDVELGRSEQDQAVARLAYRLLSNLRVVPGIQQMRPSELDTVKHRFEGDISFPIGEVDSGALASWVDEARKLSSGTGRLEICDQQIGRLLAYSPASETGVWPCESVRQLIERLKSKTLEKGLQIGLHNKRGVHFRPRGGELERAIASRFRDLASNASTRYPRTAAMLRSVAEEFEQDARREDEEGLREEFD
jgi:hypothetical protein